ncbi:MAG: HAD family hydrolase [Magnetospiraceae bacterium]
MPPARAVVFDIGGVLVDWNPRYLYRQLFKDPLEMERFLGTICTPAWNAQMDAGLPFFDATARLAARYPDHKRLIDAYRTRWPEMVRDALWETVRVLDDLHAAGVPLFALTNFSAETWPLMAARFNFIRHFEDVVVSGQERVIKPDPHIYEILMVRSNRKAPDLTFIDDNAENVSAARRLGIDGILFTTAAALRTALAARGFGGLT